MRRFFFSYACCCSTAHVVVLAYNSGFFFLVRRRLLLVLRRSITRFNTQTQMTTCMALHSMNWEWLFVFAVSVFFFQCLDCVWSHGWESDVCRNVYQWVMCNRFVDALARGSTEFVWWVNVWKAFNGWNECVQCEFRNSRDHRQAHDNIMESTTSWNVRQMDLSDKYDFLLG